MEVSISVFNCVPHSFPIYFTFVSAVLRLLYNYNRNLFLLIPEAAASLTFNILGVVPVCPVEQLLLLPVVSRAESVRDRRSVPDPSNSHPG